MIMVAMEIIWLVWLLVVDGCYGSGGRCYRQWLVVSVFLSWRAVIADYSGSRVVVDGI